MIKLSYKGDRVEAAGVVQDLIWKYPAGIETFTAVISLEEIKKVSFEMEADEFCGTITQDEANKLMNESDFKGDENDY